MKPFSSFKFFLENKKKALLTFIVIILTVCAVSFITVLINSIYDTINQIYLNMFNKISIIYTTNSITGMPDNVVTKLKTSKDIEKLVPVFDMEDTSMKLAVGGNTSIPIAFTSTENQKEVMNRVGDTLKEGRLPNKNAYEIAVHWKLMNNKGWKLGQYVGSDVNDQEWLNGKYKIVGVLDGPSVLGVGGYSNWIDEHKKAGIFNEDKPAAYIIIPKSGKLSAVNKMLSGFDKKKVSIETYDFLEKEISGNMGGLSSTLTIIIVSIVLILSISTGALMYLIYTQRSDEFGILSAMGYRRSFVRSLIIREVTTLSIISWIFGMLFSYAFIQIFNNLVYLPKGTPLNFFCASAFYNTIIIPVMIAFFSIVPILLKLRRQDAITVIERRD